VQNYTDDSSSTESNEERQLKPDQPIFFSVGLVKFVVLNILSFHYYTLVWMYKNWKYLRDNHGRRVQPVLRSIFSPLFVWQLFSEISKTVVEHGGKPPMFNPPFLALFYILCIFTANYGSRYIDPLFSFLVLVGIIPACVLQMRVNELNKRRSSITNTNFSKGNWVFIVLSSLFWIIAFYSSRV
jgi:hypothetical protein